MIGALNQDELPAMLKQIVPTCFIGLLAAGTVGFAVRLADVLKLSDDDLIDITTNGRNKMPAYKGKLTND
jgi:hypothetical protein